MNQTTSHVYKILHDSPYSTPLYAFQAMAWHGANVFILHCVKAILADNSQHVVSKHPKDQNKAVC